PGAIHRPEPRLRRPPRATLRGDNGGASGGSGPHPRGSGHGETRPARGPGRGCPRWPRKRGSGRLAGRSQSAYTTSLVLDPSTTSRARAWVEVRLDRLRDNAAALHRALGANAGLVPMVKAEAYGLGMLPVVAALHGFPTPSDPWAFGVAAVSEGERLRAAGFGGRILVFSPIPPTEYDRAAAAGLTLCLSEVAAVRRLAAAAAAQGRVLP